MSDTIFAPATAPGRAAVAVVRICGAGTAAVLRTITGGVPAPRRASLRRLRGGGGAVVDEAIVLWFPGPASFAGEDSAELQVHGGPATVAAVCGLLEAQGLRLAEPGEFTRRAFQNGRLDLTQAEGLGDLAAAETEAQRVQALAQLGGALSRRYDRWRERLLDALAYLEADLDFPDEEEAGGAAGAGAPILEEVGREMAEALGRLTGERVRDGMKVALVGAPNVGKSSLLNALLGRDAAIVTDVPGTTRDVVEGALVCEGRLVLLSDTAGLREAADAVEAEGVRRARLRAEEADLRIGVVDCSRPETAGEALRLLRPGDLLALNKRDLAPGYVLAGRDGLEAVGASALREGGVTALWDALRSRVIAGEADFPAVTRARHRERLASARAHLARAGRAGLAVELAAEDVRLAIRDIERVTGRSDPEAVLDRVFSTFCLGK